MTGRFFALELGCPEHDTYRNEGEIHEGAEVCPECEGMGCNKCKRKKVKSMTLTSPPASAYPVMNMQAMRMPLAPWSFEVILMRQNFR